MIHNIDKQEELNNSLLNLNKDYEEGKFTKIIKMSADILRKYPEEISFYILISLAYSEKGKFKEALKMLKRAEEKFQSHFEMFYQIATVYNDLGDLEEAEKYFHKSIEVTPEEFEFSKADCWNDLGVLKTKQGLKDEAAEYFNRALEIDPDHDYAFDNLVEADINEDTDYQNLDESIYDSYNEDYELFMDIQQSIYLKSVNRKKFRSMEEEDKIKMHILSAWTSEIAGNIDKSEMLDDEQKAEWYKSIEIDFSQEPAKVEMPEFDNPLYNEMSKKFSFLPPNGVSYLMLVFPYLRAVGISEDDFARLMNEDEISPDEKSKFIWASELGERVFKLSDSKSETEFNSNINEILNIASQKLSDETAQKILMKILDKMTDS